MNSKLVIGTVQFGLDYGINNYEGKPSEAGVGSILDLAFENNIKLLDTAEAYGDAHAVIGNYHKNSPNKFEIITKFDSSRADLSLNFVDRVMMNINMLNVEYLYCYMFHSYKDFETYYIRFRDEILSLKKQGLVQKFGVSVYTNQEIEELLKYDTIDIIQLPFNLLDNRRQRSSTLKRIKEKGIEIHTRSVFLQGLFFKKIEELPLKLHPLSNQLKEIHRLSESFHLKVSTLALNYVSQQADIDKLIIGVDSVDHLNENLKAFRHTISNALIHQIDNLTVKDTSLLNPSNWH